MGCQSQRCHGALQAQLPREVQGQERITAQLSGGMALIEAALDNRALPQYTMPGSSSAYSAAAAAASTQVIESSSLSLSPIANSRS